MRIRIIGYVRWALVGWLLVAWTSLAIGAEQISVPKKIDLEYIYKKSERGIPPVNSSLPRAFQWSPAGHLLAYLVSFATEAPNLVVYDPARDATAFAVTPVSLHRAVIALASASQGVPLSSVTLIKPFPEGATNVLQIDRFEWIDKPMGLRLHAGGKRYDCDAATQLLREATIPEPALPEGEKNDLTYSPNRRYAAYTRAHNLYVFDTMENKEIPLTTDGSDTLLNGRLSWVYWEELFNRSSWRGFYWSPNNREIAYLQSDESGLTTYPVIDFTNPAPSTRVTRYPKAGTKNPLVRLGVVSLSSRETRWIDLGEPYEYIARVSWTPDGKSLVVQALNRKQNKLSLLFADPRSGQCRRILQETDSEYVNVHNDPMFIRNGREFLWFSERSGYRHLYRCPIDGKHVTPITHGEWEVNFNLWEGNKPLPMDPKHRRVYFQAGYPSPLELQFYSVSFNGGRLRRYTHEPGNHRVTPATDFAYLLDSWSSVSVPQKIQVLNDQGDVIRVLGETTFAHYLPYELRAPELVEFTGPSSDRFYGSILTPPDFDPNQKYPVIFNIYGGPAGQIVTNTPPSPMDMAFVNRGYILFSMDNRGTPGRGLDWLQATYGHFGGKELEDFRAGVEFLKTRPGVDPDRIGIWGWSQGGYLTCCAMLMSPGLFHAGAAVAPVTDWKLYDTIYTEHYMGLPEQNPDGYHDGSPVHFADQLQGSLFLAHGISDDNVHIQNTYRLADALNKAAKPYHLYVYPEKDHGIPGDPDQFHLFSMLLQFFDSELGVE